MNTNWLPSHVQVTVHQARSLLLKNRNGGSGELYICVQAEKEKFFTSSVARQTEPEWDHTTDIPLMSFDTTLHFTVRQKGRIGDDFIGYITIPLGGFNISSKKPVTHWYKLGSKPGKQNTKLRGDLLLTIKFVSKWMSADDAKVLANGDTASPNGMLKRSKSDLKMKSRDSDRLLEKQTSKEKLGIFRRSFKKRPKSPVLEECADDFTTFSLSSLSPTTPTDVRKRSQTIDVRMRNTSSSSGTKNQSDSDNSDGSSGSGVQRPVSAQELFAEAAALEKDKADLPNGVTDGDSLTGNEKAVSPATKRYNFRRKKRPWSMHMIPVSTPTPTKTDNPLFGEIIPEGDNTNGSNSKPGPPEHSDSNNDSPAPITYRARSNSLARTSPRIRSQERSYSVSDSQQSVRSESNSESCSESTTPVCSPKMSSSRKAQEKTPHVRSAASDRSQRTRSSHSESSTMPDRPEGELTDVSSSADSSSRVHISDKKTSPVSLPRQSRPRLLDFGTGVSDARPSTAPASCRDGRHSLGRPALPTPSRVSPRPPSLKTSPVPLDGPLAEEEELENDVDDQRGLVEGRSTPDRSISRSTGSGRGKDRNKTSPTVRATAGRKQASDRAHRAEERTPPSSASPRKEGSRKTRPIGGISTQAPAAPRESPKQRRKPPERSSSASKPTSGDPKPKVVARNKSDTDHHRETTSNPSLGSSETSDALPTGSNSATLPRKTRMRHTVIYKGKSPLAKKTQQPVSLLPPTIAELRSQTLPTRTKLARQLSNASFFNSKSEGRVSPDKTPPRLDKNPENIRTVDRRVLNFPMGPSPTSTPIPEVPSEEESPKEEPLEETDAPAVGVGQEPVSDTTLAQQHANENHVDTTAVSTATAADAATTAVSGTEDQKSSSAADTPGTSSGAAAVSRKSPLSSSLNWKRIHERRPMAGGLKRALNAYQENRRETARVRKSIEETQRVSDFGTLCSSSANVSADTDRQFLLSSEQADERLSVSLCNSPELRRRKNAESTSRSSWSNPFNSLRWRSSSTNRPRSTGDFEPPDMGLPQNQSASVPATPHKLSQELHSSHTSSPLPNQQIASAPGSSSNKWERTHTRSLSSQSASPVSATNPMTIQPDVDTSALPPSPRISVTSINGDVIMPLHHQPYSQAIALKSGSVGSLGVLTPTDSDSIKTLTESQSNLQQSMRTELPLMILPGGGNNRQTCSSVESEGLGSLTSEELSLEDLVHQDWGQWSKEELVKELIHSKQRLKGMEDELLSVKRYLDNLLLRIMETNPSILSATH